VLSNVLGTRAKSREKISAGHIINCLLYIVYLLCNLRPELLAIVDALRKIRVYIYGHKVTQTLTIHL
jgi:hypothetical protein